MGTLATVPAAYVPNSPKPSLIDCREMIAATSVMCCPRYAVALLAQSSFVAVQISFLLSCWPASDSAAFASLVV